MAIAKKWSVEVGSDVGEKPMVLIVTEEKKEELIFILKSLDSAVQSCLEGVLGEPTQLLESFVSLQVYLKAFRITINALDQGQSD